MINEPCMSCGKNRRLPAPPHCKHQANHRVGAEQQTITLVKTDEIFGGMSKGWRVSYRVDSELPTLDANARAYRLLKREHPDENPMCWAVVDDR